MPLGTAALAGLAAAVPAWLLCRRPAADGLVTAAGGGRRRPSRLARLARRARLPLPAVLGIAAAFARRPRAVLAILALALSLAAGVCALAIDADLDADARREARLEAAEAPPAASRAGPNAAPFTAAPTISQEDERGRRIVYAGAGILTALALANLVAALALTLREDRREAGILRAVGLTPREAAFTVTSRQIVLALAAVIVGIPLGIGLWRLGNAIADDSQAPVTDPSALALVAAAAAAIAVCALVTAPLARHAARLPVTEVLRQD